jgi:hypothetical protein
MKLTILIALVAGILGLELLRVWADHQRTVGLRAAAKMVQHELLEGKWEQCLTGGHAQTAKYKRTCEEVRMQLGHPKPIEINSSNYKQYFK